MGKRQDRFDLNSHVYFNYDVLENFVWRPYFLFLFKSFDPHDIGSFFKDTSNQLTGIYKVSLKNCSMFD